jgi:homoserine kinase
MAAVQALRAAGLPAAISGAGPSVIVLGAAGDLARVQACLADQPDDYWVVRQCPVQPLGARVEPVDGAVASG